MRTAAAAAATLFVDDSLELFQVSMEAVGPEGTQRGRRTAFRIFVLCSSARTENEFQPPTPVDPWNISGFLAANGLQLKKC